MNDDNAAIMIAYGSNLPPALALPMRNSASQAFAQVVKSLQDKGLIITKLSRLWRSQAWPDPSQPSYVNAVLQIETDLQPVKLMAFLHSVERDFGRTRTNERNASRVLDLDLIAYGRAVTDDQSGLILPHPRAHDRAFVMGPLAEISPEWVHPLLQRTAKSLYDSATVATDAYPLDDDA